VTITSKSALNDDPSIAARNIADLISRSCFYSKDEPDRWVCWDFHEMRVSPTHYTIKCLRLKSWVIESSLDGEVWTEIDRKTDIEDFKGSWTPASFAVSNSAPCRFVRLTQTGENHGNRYTLYTKAVEIFGTLFE
jgi:hypothetical protein